MTVRELIEELKKMPPEAPVWTEGCDCVGDCASVTLEPNGDVYINRGVD